MARNEDRQVASLTRAAMAGAAIMIAHQVASKAARDSLFLDQFPSTDLPKMMGTAALIAVLGGVLFARLLLLSSPARILGATLAGSALLHVVEFVLLGETRGPVVVLVYLHIVASSGISLSLFWSMASESFSPGEAKRYYGRITAAGTAGGITGGLLAERVATTFSVDSLLLLLAALHAFSLVVVLVVGGRSSSRRSIIGSDNFKETIQNAVRRAPFLKSLAMLILLTTLCTAFIDFLFKSNAAAEYGKGPALARFFAFFYTGTQAAAFLAQSTITPIALRSLGLGRTVMALPVALAVGGFACIWAPVLSAFTATRAGELILKGSLFRAGYELFYTPIPAAEKRAVKTAIDVAFDRFGEVVAALLIQAFLFLGLDYVSRPLLVVVVIFAGICMWVATRMDKAYLRALEQGLLHRAVELDETDIQDSTTLSGLMHSIAVLKTVPHAAGTTTVTSEVSRTVETLSGDASLDRLRMLRSGRASEVRKALDPARPYDAIVIPQIVRLLAWDEVTTAARQFLETHGKRVTGQLTDALLDQQQDFSVRRRIPRILAQLPGQRTVEALQDVLDDARFEIRFQSSRALEFVHRGNPELRFSRERLMEAVERDLSVSRTIWEGRRLLGNRDESDAAQILFLDDILRGRANQSMEHVFSLLAILLPREPLKVAFRALHSDDRVLRGLGLEYLDTALPARTFALFKALLTSDSPISRRAPEEVLDQLMKSQDSIRIQIRNASGGVPVTELPPRRTTPA